MTNCKTGAAAFLLLCVLASTAVADDAIERGRYLAMITGCNDCHTPGFMQKESAVPESEWLQGDVVGWRGPWGTTYATNLRQRLSAMTVDEWVAFARGMKARPPMPWWSVNNMTDKDLRALYAYVRSLGPSDHQVPAYLPPGEEPATPYMDLGVKLPVAAGTQ